MTDPAKIRAIGDDPDVSDEQRAEIERLATWAEELDDLERQLADLREVEEDRDGD